MEKEGVERGGRGGRERRWRYRYRYCHKHQHHCYDSQLGGRHWQLALLPFLSAWTQTPGQSTHEGVEIQSHSPEPWWGV